MSSQNTSLRNLTSLRNTSLRFIDHVLYVELLSSASLPLSMRGAPFTQIKRRAIMHAFFIDNTHHAPHPCPHSHPASLLVVFLVLLVVYNSLRPTLSCMHHNTYSYMLYVIHQASIGISKCIPQGRRRECPR
jgi:heme A synthase